MSLLYNWKIETLHKLSTPLCIQCYHRNRLSTVSVLKALSTALAKLQSNQATSKEREVVSLSLFNLRKTRIPCKRQTNTTIYWQGCKIHRGECKAWFGGDFNCHNGDWKIRCQISSQLTSEMLKQIQNLYFLRKEISWIMSYSPFNLGNIWKFLKLSGDRPHNQKFQISGHQFIYLPLCSYSLDYRQNKEVDNY